MTASQALVGDLHVAGWAAVKCLLMFVLAVAAFRVTERRTLGEMAPYDFAAAVAVGAIVGRTATSSTTAWTTGAAALVALLLAHSLVSRLRYLPAVARLVDPPVLVLVQEGQVRRRALVRCGLTEDDLVAVLRQHGHDGAATVRLAVFETKGTVSVLAR